MEKQLTPHIKRRGQLLPPPFIPYDYQAPIIKKMVEQVLQGKNGLVIQPTATGKSVEAAFTARALILLYGKRGLYLYDENEGLSQARLKFDEIFNKNDILCANFFGYGKDKNVEEADIVFASFQSFNNHREKWYQSFDQKHFDFVIVNEAHHGQAVTYKEVIDYFKCPKIGMTATPVRMDGRDILEIFNEVICEIPLEEAIVKGWVAQVEYHILSHGISTQKLKKICHDVLEEGKRISIKQLNETIFIEMLDEEVKKEIYKYAFPEGKKPRQILIFCENIKHANIFLEKLKEDGMAAECVHSGRTKDQNRGSMKQFRNGNVQFLLSVDKLNEDIDVPNVELGVFLRATDSLTVFLQQMGRLLRKTRSKDKAIILDFVANCERMILIQDLVDKIEKRFVNLPLERNPIHVTGIGFDFSFTKETIDVLKMLQAIREGFYPTWKEASEAAIKNGITSASQYYKKYKKDSRLHSAPNEYYFDFPGWTNFLGKGIAPEGWFTASTLVKNNIISRAFVTIQACADQYRIEKQEWFNEYYGENGNLVEHYHPDLIEKIKEELDKPVAPKRWMTNSKLRIILHRGEDTIKSFFQKYRKTRTDWFKFYLQNGHRVEHYHPDLVKMILKKYGVKENAPNGWVSIRELTVTEKRSSSTIKSIINTLRKDNEGLIGKFIGENKSYAEHYSPLLVEKIKKQLREYELLNAPDGWRSIASLVKDKKLVGSRDRVINFANQFRETKPAWFNFFRTQKKLAEHYHPDLVQKIKEHFAKK